MMTQKKGNPYNKLFNTLSGVRLMPSILSQINILCSSLVKPYYTKWRFTRYLPSTRYDHFTRLQHIGFHRSGVIRIWNVQCFIWSKNSVFNFTAVRYSLHKCSKMIYRTRVTCFPYTGVHGSKKNVSPSSLDLNLVSSLLQSALQSKLYQDFRYVDYLKGVLLHCWVW